MERVNNSSKRLTAKDCVGTAQEWRAMASHFSRGLTGTRKGSPAFLRKTWSVKWHLHPSADWSEKRACIVEKRERERERPRPCVTPEQRKQPHTFLQPLLLSLTTLNLSPHSVSMGANQKQAMGYLEIQIRRADPHPHSLSCRLYVSCPIQEALQCDLLLTLACQNTRLSWRKRLEGFSAHQSHL